GEGWPLDESARLREPGGRFALVVLDEELDLAARDLVADLLEEELIAVDHVLAVGGQRPALRHDHADFDGPLLRGGRRGRHHQRGAHDGEEQEGLDHRREASSTMRSTSSASRKRSRSSAVAAARTRAT